MNNKLYIEEDLDDAIDDIYKLFDEQDMEKCDIISSEIKLDENNNKYVHMMISCYIDELDDYLDIDINITKDVLLDMLDKIK